MFKALLVFRRSFAKKSGKSRYNIFTDHLLNLEKQTLWSCSTVISKIEKYIIFTNLWLFQLFQILSIRSICNNNLCQMVIPSDCHIFGSGSRLPHVFQPSNIRLVRTIGGEKNSWVSSAEFFVLALDDLMVGPAFGPFCAFVGPFPNLVFGQKGSNATFTLVRIGALQWNYWSVKFSLFETVCNSL